MTTRPDPQPGPFLFGLCLGLLLAAAAVATTRRDIRRFYAEPPFDPRRHIELTTPAGDVCRLSGPGRFDVLDHAYPFPQRPTR